MTTLIGVILGLALYELIKAIILWSRDDKH